ncbi:Lrp/AsnC family transcriptional regulator [Manganibacter manganicus]|uniref:AsnC family transcriptional regulator n=1 Tax=Manganibacter manganicus TaxID=1873176 RepID=A0A1V8RQV4_9HYPH|nr:Lrp/AsnC family transcriptional regulator [Pseudaminobacter manganicus]OQM75557.1 AsnC family transcriptional regulator [Pseudaminobacter manganicus]
MKELDAKDRAILAILSREARIPMKALAARVGLSRSAASERVTQLERTGVIRGYRADIGQMEPNAIRAFLLITLSHTPAIDMLDTLASYSEVRRVSSISGHLDLVIEVEVPSIDRLNTMRDIMASAEAVHDLTTLIVLRRDIDRAP